MCIAMCIPKRACSKESLTLTLKKLPWGERERNCMLRIRHGHDHSHSTTMMMMIFRAVMNVEKKGHDENII